MTKIQRQASNIALVLNEGFAYAKVQTKGVGLGVKQGFEALKSTGKDAIFSNECFFRGIVKNGVVGVELLSKDFKQKAFVPKDKIVSLKFLAMNLRELANSPLQKGAQNADN